MIYSLKYTGKVFTKSDTLSHLYNLKEMVSDEEYYLAIKEVE